jgi:predicted transposase/invertase (TIGR01784 family)
MSIGITPLIDYALIQNKTRANDKLSILDILAVDELGRQLNIEVQTSIPAGLAKRLAYHTCVSYSRQLKKGQNYLTLRPSISICVLNGAMFSNPAKLHEEFRLQSTSSQLTLTEDLQIHLLQLNHLQVTAENLYTPTAVERWAWFLRNVDQITVQNVARLFPDQVFNAKTQGLVIGQLRGQIILLQRLLQQRVWTEQDFESCDVDRLQAYADELQLHLGHRSLGD